MLSEDEGFNVALMADGKLARKAEGMRRAALCAEQSERRRLETAKPCHRLSGLRHRKLLVDFL
jgi:hypothetical protein